MSTKKHPETRRTRLHRLDRLKSIRHSSRDQPGGAAVQVMGKVVKISSKAGAGKGAAAPVPVEKVRTKVARSDKRPDLSGAVTARVRDVMAYADLSRTQIWKLERDGRLKVVRIGRTVLIRMDSVHAIVGGPPARVQQEQA